MDELCNHKRLDQLAFEFNVTFITFPTTVILNLKENTTATIIKKNKTNIIASEGNTHNVQNYDDDDIRQIGGR